MIIFILTKKWPIFSYLCNNITANNYQIETKTLKNITYETQPYSFCDGNAGFGSY